MLNYNFFFLREVSPELGQSSHPTSWSKEDRESAFQAESWVLLFDARSRISKTWPRSYLWLIPVQQLSKRVPSLEWTQQTGAAQWWGIGNLSSSSGRFTEAQLSSLEWAQAFLASNAQQNSKCTQHLYFQEFFHRYISTNRGKGIKNAHRSNIRRDEKKWEKNRNDPSKET